MLKKYMVNFVQNELDVLQLLILTKTFYATPSHKSLGLITVYSSRMAWNISQAWTDIYNEQYIFPFFCGQMCVRIVQMFLEDIFYII